MADKTNPKNLFKTYLQELAEIAQRGDAREESFYPALKAMLEGVAQAAGRADVRVTQLPKRTDAGNPDFRLWNGTDRIVGYIEAKEPREEHLDRIEESEQLRRLHGPTSAQRPFCGIIIVVSRHREFAHAACAFR